MTPEQEAIPMIEADIQKWIDDHKCPFIDRLNRERTGPQYGIDDYDVIELANQFQSAFKAKEDEAAELNRLQADSLARLALYITGECTCPKPPQWDSSNGRHFPGCPMIARAEIARLGALVPRWIPVSERLPEPLDCYLVWQPGRTAWAFFTSQRRWAIDNEFLEGITHWQPIPKPPTTEPHSGEYGEKV